MPINLGSGARALGEREIAQKFRGTAGLMLSPDRVDALLDALLSPGKHKVRAMLQLLRAA
ncbi:hypothetical protein [Paraburkholderia franconis]|uniref:hypothetical protein n=1 Tax=Paraburkholderia franconis TaxID=2654983 RepID=UPI001D112E6E|nr:hypothetical protein [Paraburkholderia franconis]